MADITMPQLGETVTEGTITRWLKQVGESVAEDEVLFEVSTDKVDSEVPSPAAGVVTEILVQEGETVDVGTRLAVISDGAAAPASSNGSAGEGAADDPAPSIEAEQVPAPEGAAGVVPTGTARAEARASSSSGPSGDAGTGPQAPAPEAEAPGAAPAVAAAGSPPSAPGEQRNAAATRPGDARPPARPGDGRVLSPVVRRLIADHNIDPSEITGTGAGGRITRNDVLDLIDKRAGGAAATGAPSAPATDQAAPASPAGGPAAPRPAAPPAVAGARDTIVPFTNIRRRTAEHMVRSKATSAHTMVAVEVDYAGVEAVRAAEKARFRESEGFGLTYLPFIARAVVDALGDFPHVNSSVGDDQLIVHGDINLGIAVDLDFEGLLVPVIHEADGKRLRALARDISTLASRARARKLTVDDISGGTLTLTNAGPFGTFITVPVINQPQVAIISTDGVRKRPVVVELPDGSDAIVVHPVGNLVMSWDHRAFDGAYAAAFLAAVKTVLETRDWSSEL
ncbi:MAG TPA: dihydrolipoamide acetyltransferase family protein [Acidimicrobiales bacterium]|nr:dihydrolipoamide acetyltransferase family protein [Acidimicrobiales bacterium]